MVRAIRESYNVSVRHYGRLVHSPVVCQQLLASAPITDEELAEDEIVAAHFVTAQERVQFGCVRRSIGEEPNPDRGVNQNDHAVTTLLPAFAAMAGHEKWWTRRERLGYSTFVVLSVAFMAFLNYWKLLRIPY